MSRSISNKLENLYSDYLQIADSFGVFESSVRLGEIWNCLQNSKLSGPARNRWELKIKEGQSVIAVRSDLESELNEKLGELLRVVSTGTDFTYEELVAVISRRIELDLVLGLPTTSFELDRSIIEEIDSNIRTLSASPANQSAFSSAKESVRKNWGSPIKHQLLLQ